MGLHSTALTEQKEETFRQSRDRAAFETMRRQLKNLIELRLCSTDPGIRAAASQWQEIVKQAEAK